MDASALLSYAQLSAAAYTDGHDARAAAAAALGFETIGTYENGDHRAFVCRSGTRHILVLCGTRFSDGNIRELMDDAYIAYVPVGGPAKVMAGFHAGMHDLFAWALGLVPGSAQLELTGHSLGGARAHLAPVFMPEERIAATVSFGAPKAANAAYWQRLAKQPTRVVHGRDLWAGWPFHTLWGCCHPDALLWCAKGTLAPIMEAQWPGGLDPTDHDITGGYCASLTALIPKAA